MKKCIMFVKKNLKINIWKIKDNIEWGLCHYTGEYRGAVHSIFNLEYSVPKKIPIFLHNESNHDYHSIIKEFAEEVKKQFKSVHRRI